MSKGLWISVEILKDRGLTPMEKLILAEIMHLHSVDGCHALNKHFAVLFGIGKSRASQIISGLSLKGRIECRLERKGKQIISRTITPLENLNTPFRKPEDPLEKSSTTPLEKREDTKQVTKHSTKQQTACGGGSASGFDAFWEAYPRKVNKKAAEKAWAKLSPTQRLQDDILAALDKQKQLDGWQKDNGKYIPHASTWLNDARWEDVIAADPTGTETLETHDITEAEAEELMLEVAYDS